MSNFDVLRDASGKLRSAEKLYAENDFDGSDNYEDINMNGINVNFAYNNGKINA